MVDLDGVVPGQCLWREDIKRRMKTSQVQTETDLLLSTGVTHLVMSQNISRVKINALHMAFVINPSLM
jgi:hypothetical protein